VLNLTNLKIIMSQIDGVLMAKNENEKYCKCVQNILNLFVIIIWVSHSKVSIRTTHNIFKMS